MIGISTQSQYFGGARGIKKKPLSRAQKDAREIVALTKGIVQHRTTTAAEAENHRQKVISAFHQKYRQQKN